MTTYKITHIASAMMFQHMFAAGTCVGGFAGISLGILERDAVGILGGAFLGLVFGLGLGFFSMLCTEVFNVLAPYLGGIAIEMEEMKELPAKTREPIADSTKTTDTDQASGA